MPSTTPKEAYTRTEVRRLLGISEIQLKSWERHGLVPALDTFSFADLKVVRNLCELRKTGVSLARIRKAVAEARAHMEDLGEPLRSLKLVTDGRHIRVEVGGQRIEPASGQLVLDFDAATLQRLVSFPVAKKPNEQHARRHSAEAWFQKGLELEQAGAPVEEAISAYESAVKIDPGSAGAWLNLGTIYFNARVWTDAERYYRRALDADPDYALAHFNIANLYDERGDWSQAVEHYRTALRLNPAYADAHYNMALLCQNRGRVLESLNHWRAYLKLDPASQWADIARRELAKLKKSTVVEGRSHFRVVGEGE